MPRISGKIDGLEREICARLKLYRERIKWSQTEFALAVGLSRDQLAGIEYARTPLRYDVAWTLRSLFGLSLTWLLVGVGDPRSISDDDLPRPNETGLPQNALLTEVSGKFAGELPKSGTGGFGLEPPPISRLNEDDINHRRGLLSRFRDLVKRTLEKLPEGYTENFYDLVARLSKDYMAALPEDAEELVEARRQALMWAEIGFQVEKNTALLFSDPQDQTPQTTKKNPRQCQPVVDTGAPSDKVIPVIRVPTTWEALANELRKATSAPGAKANLAREFGVSRQAVNKWLTKSKTGAGAPSAELTLRLLAWVTAEMAKQQKNPAGARTPAEPKAQVRNQYEKKPNSDPP